MAYLTAIQATALLVAEGSDSNWPSQDAERLKWIERASRRIEAIPFDVSVAYNRPRFKDGKWADMNGDATSQDMPFELQLATAVLAAHYADYPMADRSLIGSDGDVENALSVVMADLPIRVQSTLYPYLSDELKPADSRYDEQELLRLQQEGFGDAAGGDGGFTAAPLVYKEG